MKAKATGWMVVPFLEEGMVRKGGTEEGAIQILAGIQVELIQWWSLSC